VDCAILGDDPSDSITGSNCFYHLSDSYLLKSSTDIANVSSFSNLKLCQLRCLLSLVN